MPPPPPPPSPSGNARSARSGANKGKSSKKKDEMKLTFDAEEPIQAGEDLSNEGKFFSLHKSHNIGGHYSATLTTITRRNANKKGTDKRGEVVGKSLCMQIKRAYTDGKNDFAFNLPCERIKPLFKVIGLWLGKSTRHRASDPLRAEDQDDDDDDDDDDTSSMMETTTI